MELEGLGRSLGELPALRFQLLGMPTWHLAGGDSQSLSRKDAALISILALDGPQARDVLAGRLWPNVNEARAAASLRQRVSRLRRDTGHQVLHTGQSVRLADGVAVDAGDICTMSAEALLELGELLAGFDYADNELIHGWVATQRERLRRTRSDALVGHAHRLESRGELASALRLSDCILKLMPLQEHAWRHQMRLHYLRGDRSSAIQSFERFEALLREETGARPSEETLELLRLIEAAVQRRPQRRAVVPACLVRPPLLVGRDAELQAMTRAWSGGKAFLLLADGGMGKSRLLADFLQGRLGVVREQGRPGDARAPYSVLSRILRAAAAEYPLATAVTGALASLELAQGLPGFGSAVVGKPSSADLWLAAEAALVDAKACGLTGVVVDDLHHADRATAEALRWLNSSVALRGLRMGLAARPPGDALLASVLSDWLDDSRPLERIFLPLLRLEDVAKLVESLDVEELCLPGLGQRLFEHAGGHPLFTLETLKAALLQGHDPAVNPLPMPTAVQASLSRRLSELPGRALPLLHVAAVAGPDLTVERAARMLGRNALDLAGPWADLESANVLRGLRFVCEMVRISALQLLPEPVQHVLHASLARVLTGEAEVTPGRLAERWEAGERWAEAATCWHAAAMAGGHAGRRAEQRALLARAEACRRRAGISIVEFDLADDPVITIRNHQGGLVPKQDFPRAETLPETRTAG